MQLWVAHNSFGDLVAEACSEEELLDQIDGYDDIAIIGTVTP